MYLKSSVPSSNHFLSVTKWRADIDRYRGRCQVSLCSSLLQWSSINWSLQPFLFQNIWTGQFFSSPSPLLFLSPSFTIFLIHSSSFLVWKIPAKFIYIHHFCTSSCIFCCGMSTGLSLRDFRGILSVTLSSVAY